jgi:hypothetical protein
MVQGLGTTAWESLSLAAVGDMFYLHERGWRTAFTVATLTCTVSLVSIIAGVMTQNCGWKSLFVAELPFNIAGMLATFFLLPETQFKRPTTKAATTPPPNHEAEKLTTEKASTAVVETTSGKEAAPTSRPRMSYLQSLKPWSSETYTDKSIPHLLIEIFVHFINPAMTWILLVSAVLIGLFVVTAFILAQIWSAPPYLLNVAQNGYFYTGSLIGGFTATLAGPLCDWSARLLARMNHGIFEAEFRLPVNIIAVAACALGWFLFMWDINNPTANGYVLGSFCYGLVCFGISIPSTSAGLYIL